MGAALTPRLPLWVTGDPPLYRFARVLLAGAVYAYGRVELLGLGNLPTKGPALLVCNHPSDFDPVILAIGLPRTLWFMGAAREFRRPIVGQIIPLLGAFPVEHGRVDRRALRTALDLLARGEVVAVFPEGDDIPGSPHRFETGAGFLAGHSGAPLVPAAIRGTDAILSGGRLRRPLVRLRVGAPLDLAGVTGSRHERNTTITRLAEDSVRELYESLG